ncbi:MAG: sigma-70 family RNA polymerase sigma factor [Planctomycetota bacterium]
MSSWPDTEPTLVHRLGDRSDEAAWARFDELYRPVIYRFARSEGLQHSDAEALVAEVMSRVFRAAGRWASGADGERRIQADARPTRFRAWLCRVARNALLNLVTRQLKQRGTGGTSHQLSMVGRPHPNDFARERWEAEHRQHVFRLAALRVQAGVDDLHWQVFWQSHIEGMSIPDVAAQFDQSIGSVYAIRSRLLKRLRSAVEQISSLEEDAETGR